MPLPDFIIDASLIPANRRSQHQKAIDAIDAHERTGAPFVLMPSGEEAGAGVALAPSPTGRRWADLMRRAFDVDVLACPRCGGRLRLLALLEAGAVTERILRHLGRPAEVPAARPARAPPLTAGDGPGDRP